MASADVGLWRPAQPEHVEQEDQKSTAPSGRYASLRAEPRARPRSFIAAWLMGSVSLLFYRPARLLPAVCAEAREGLCPSLRILQS